MLIITKKAAALLKLAKATDGVGSDTGIRIGRGPMPIESGIPVGFSFSDERGPDDEEFEHDGLRIFVEDAFVKSLDGLILDVHYDNNGPELILR
jgi:Fe-S cluster assembly iron-binding protein IscA